MTVFKAFLRVLNSCKGMIILYTAITVAVCMLRMSSGDTTTDFSASKPSILIVNNDEESKLTENLVKYMTESCDVEAVDTEDEEAISDSLFYREISYVMYIPENFGFELLAGGNPQIEVKGTEDYEASYAGMLLSGYLGTAKTCAKYIEDEEALIETIEDTLSEKTEVRMDAAGNMSASEEATTYYNFVTYAVIAACVYSICMVLASFRDERIHKRTVISSMKSSKFNAQLLLSNGLFALTFWFIYVIFGIILVGDSMLSPQGVLYMANLFIFTVCALTLAFFIGNLVTDRNAIGGIINVVALGSSFLCGAFVPVEFLPDAVLNIARVLPSYWYIQSNEYIKTVDKINKTTLEPLIKNSAIVLLFAVGFAIAANIIAKKRRKIG